MIFIILFHCKILSIHSGGFSESYKQSMLKVKE